MYTGLVKFLNQHVKPLGVKYKYNNAVEQYRGICALLVMSTHSLGEPGLLLNNFRWPSFVSYFGAGYLSVIVFFCISGYVIGITNTNSEQFKIGGYLKKRIVRLYPTYLIALVICIIVAGGVSLYVLIGNLLFLQNGFPYYHISIPIFVNFATWSLNNEFLYYLLFIPIVIWQPKIWKILVVLFLLSITLIPATKPYLFLSSYINGYYFWLLGLILGWSIIQRSSTDEVKSISFLSILFLHLSINHLGVGQIILHTIGIYSSSNINWLFDLPFCIFIMGLLTGKSGFIFTFSKVLSYLMPAFIFIYLIATNRIFEDTRWIMCLIYWALSILFYFEKKLSAFLMEKLTGVGKISYGLYLLHVPVALLIKKTVFISNQTLEVTVKYTLWLFITFLLSYLLEIHLQPAVKKYFAS